MTFGRIMELRRSPSNSWGGGDGGVGFPKERASRSQCSSQGKNATEHEMGHFFNYIEDPADPLELLETSYS